MKINANLIGSTDKSVEYPMGRILFEIIPEHEFEKALVELARNEPENVLLSLALCVVPLGEGFLRYKLNWSSESRSDWHEFKGAKESND